ncbi:MAG: response regulator [bacterium]|nr:response regulator [bacterium]
MGIFKRIRGSFASKLMFALIPLFLLNGIILIINNQIIERRYLLENLRERGKSFARILAFSSQLGVYSENKNLLEQNSKSLFYQDDLKYMVIYNASGKIVYQQEKISPIKTLTKYQFQELKNGNKEYIEFDYGKGKKQIFTFWVPIIFDVKTTGGDDIIYFEEESTEETTGKIIGVVGIGVTSESLFKHLAATQAKSIWLTLIFMVISFIFLAVILNRLTDPITKLIDGIHGVSTGDYSKRIKVGTVDEVGILANEYNQMLDKLQNNIKRLEAAQTTTESAYNQLIKTSEALEESNLKLTSRIEQLTALREINEAITPDKQKIEIFKLLLKKIVHTIDIERGAIFEYDKEKKKIRGAFILGDQNISAKDFTKITLDINENNLIALSIKDNEFYFITDLKNDMRWNINELRSKSCGIFPVSAGEEVFACLFVDNPYSNRIISNEDIQTLVTFSETAGLALHNLALYQQLKTQLEELEIKNRELLKLDQLKSDFLANVSHELRTPLTSIKGYTEYILSKKLGPLTEQQEKGLLVSSRNIQRLMQLINDLLDFTKIDSGKEKIDVKPFVLDSLLSDLLHSFKNDIKDKRMNVEINSPDNLPPVLGDKIKLGQVIENLFKNAMKFTPEEGRISITAHWNLASGKKIPDLPPNKVRIILEDTGIGIKKAELPKIFERFYQVDGSSRRKFGGTGLGLAIVKSILDAHKSKVYVDSDEGKGTTFYFDLELEMKEYEAKASDSTLVDFNVGTSKSKTILVIDDEKDIIDVLRLYLEEKNFNIIASETGYQGIEFARVYKPDLIILDILLPDIDGYKVLDVLSNDEQTKDIPVIILSILKDVMKGKNYEIVDYIAKPFDRSLMLDAIKKVFAGKPQKSKYHLVVVDDEHDTTDMLKASLESEGYEVTGVYHAKELYQTLEKQIPDLILLDIMMPEIDGWEVIETLKNDERYQEIPIIIISAKTSIKDKNKGMQLGAIEYMTKPFKVEDVLQEIQMIIDKNINQ